MRNVAPEERRCRRGRLGVVALRKLPHFFLLVYLSENKRKFHSENNSSVLRKLGLGC